MSFVLRQSSDFSASNGAKTIVEQGGFARFSLPLPDN
jgi:hypothetical protein